MSADGNILAWQKCMCAKFVASLIVVVFIGIVVEYPAGVLGATGFVDQTTDLVFLACPKSPNSAVLAILLPEQRVDVSLGVERRNKVVAMARRAIGKFPGAGKVQHNTIEVNQFTRHIHGPRTSRRAINLGLAGAHHDDCQDDASISWVLAC